MAVLVDVTRGIDVRKTANWKMDNKGTITLSEAYLMTTVKVPDGYERVSPNSLQLRPVWLPCRHRLLKVAEAPGCNCLKAVAKCSLLLKRVDHAYCSNCGRREP